MNHLPYTIDLAREQFAIYIEVYKQHFDLFVRGSGLYVVAVGILAGILFRDVTANSTRSLLSFGIAAFSFAALFGCIVSWVWVRQLQKNIDHYTSIIQAESFPLGGAKGIIITVGIVSIMLVGAGSIYGIILRSALTYN